MKYLDMEAKVRNWFKELNPVYKASFWWTFALINLAFSFHTINFMFGDHDWNYVRAANYWSEGSFEGRPLHFVLQSVFFGGHVLPILNNLLSFAALAISGLLLARYWKIPLTTLNYTLFATFVAVLPLTMVWLFYAKDTLINLSLPLIVIAGLMASENQFKNKVHILAILLFYFAFSSYMAIINLLAVVLLGSIIISYADGESIKEIIKKKIPTIVDALIALILFMLTLTRLSLSSDYNTKTVSWDIIPQKLMETTTVMFTQLISPIPFMEYKYKLLLLALFLFGIILVCYKSGIRKIPVIVTLILAVLFASKLAFFIADERNSVLAELENFAFVPRLDFYGLSYIYALGAAFVLSKANGKFYKAGVTLAIVLIFMSIVRDMYAQKVWKLGFDAEMKAHERIVNRLEQLPEFNADRKYRLLQIGSLSLRQNFYKEVKDEQKSLDLLSAAYTPPFMSRIVYNFYYPNDIFIDNVDVRALSSAGRDYLRQAKVWPSVGSIFIDNDIVIIVLTEEGLNKVKGKL